jgi:hypothetical protein
MNQAEKISKSTRQRAAPSPREAEEKRQQRLLWYCEGYLDALKDNSIDNTAFVQKMKQETNVTIQEVRAS